MADRGLNIAVDGRELVGRPTGVGRYLRALLDEWSVPTFPHRLTVIAPAGPPDDLVLPAHMRWTVAESARSGTWWEQTRLPSAVARESADVLFAAGYTAPLRLTCPFVLAVYDVSFWAHPEWFPAREGFRRRKLTRAAARRAHSVITISDFSAREITTWLGIPAGRIRLAAPGPPFPLEAAATGARDPLVLFVGSLFTRRHIPALIEAFADVARAVPDARLVLVGDNRTSPRIDPVEHAARHGLANRVDWLTYVDDDELNRLYGRARVFAFLSEYEGFGLTPLEALAHGAPSVLLDTPVAREVYGDSAVFVPLDRAAIGGAIADLLGDESRRAALLTAGRARWHQVSWSASAATVLHALELAAGTA